MENWCRLSPDIDVDETRKHGQNVTLQCLVLWIVRNCKAIEIATHHNAARFSHAPEFGDSLLRVIDPLHDVLGPHHVKACVGERQIENAALPEFHVLKAIFLRTTLSVDDVVVADIHPNY
jgi:hypothetical protein